jgi:hypothetical protein
MLVDRVHPTVLASTHAIPYDPAPAFSAFRQNNPCELYEPDPRQLGYRTHWLRPGIADHGLLDALVGTGF